MKRVIFGAVATVLGFSTTGSHAGGDMWLAPLAVTATLSEQPVADVNASVQVIDRAQIEASGSRSLAEVLQYAHGAHVRDTGSGASISMRGFESGHTLVLVNGMRRTEKFAGSNVNNISLENVERIEIVRGPMSALYGSEALGGVINVITRRPERPQAEARLTLGATGDGQRETTIAHLSGAWAGAGSSHRLGLEAKRREPFRVDEDSEATDLREERRLFLNYDGRFEFASGASLALAAEYVDQDDEGVGVDRTGASYARFEEEQRYFLGATYATELGAGLFDLHLGHGGSSAKVNRGTAADETTEFDQYQAETTYARELGADHAVTLGAGYRLDEVEISTLARPVERKVAHAFLQDQWFLTDTVDLTLGGRYDRYNDFGETFNPRVTLAWRPAAWTLRASYGTGFKAPTLLQLYMQDMVRGRFLIRGNPDLDAETSRTLEAAVRYGFRRGHIELIAHRSRVADLVAAAPTGATVDGLSELVYQNVDEAEIDGVELIIGLLPADTTRLDAGLEYLDARDADSDERLTDRARWQARASLSQRLGSLTVTARVRHLRDFWSPDPNQPGAPNYNSNFTSAALHLDYALAAWMDLFAGVDNLFDAEMPDNMGFRGTPDDPGARYYYTGVKARF